ncbi:MAG: DUF2793 domain-containing protein [Pseudolabrys sp.]
MTDTANLALPCIEGSQAQKHITHNDALRILDTLVQLAVLDRDLTAPPGSPAEGQRWIVKAAATGAWAGHDNAVAAWQDGGWQFSAPQTGWCAFVADEGTLLVWNGAAWGDFFSTVTSIQNLALLGIGTAADAANALSAKLNNALFVAKPVAEGGDGTLRYKLSKESATKTLSFLFQDNFSGRAEIGLTGDDDFHFKVSPDGSTWYEGIRIAAATGRVSFPAGGPREVLAADRTYYVRTDGSDSNDGLSNSAGGAFLTIQKALDVVFGTLDLGGYNVTIQVGAGTYANVVEVDYPQTGAGVITLQGDVTTPSNVVINTTSLSHAVRVYAGVLCIRGLKLTTSGTGNCIQARYSGVCKITGNMEFGAAAQGHISGVFGGAVAIEGANYTISGSAPAHYSASDAGKLLLADGGAFTVTLVGTPAFSSAFAAAGNLGYMQAQGITFSGSATGTRYSASGNSVIRTDGGGVNYFPGNAAGATASGGLYL